jgi:flagellar hook-associated protein 3 FlgL
MALYPVPTSRTSEFLVQQRLISQLQGDSLDLLRLQTQISTGQRIQLPSEDPAAAFRAQGLQRLLELKSQLKTNINTSQSYIDATDNAIQSVSELLTDARGLALSAVDSANGPTQRAAAAAQIERTLQQLIDVGNHQFRGRYLFAGAKLTDSPFVSLTNGLVAYTGNTGKIQSFGDLELLFESNFDGDAMFGAISTKQTGTVDLNPIVTEDTLLSDLNGGNGVSPGSIQISDGDSSSTIDLSSADTIGDVARLIEASPPEGRTLVARVTPRGLTISLDAAGNGNLSIQEVGGGTTAAELGIKSTATIGTGPLTGNDLNPRLRETTRLADLLGVRSSAILESSGTNNNIAIDALQRGSQFDGATVQLVDDHLLHASPGLLAGNETVSYSATATPARAAVVLSGFNNNLLLTASTAGVDFNNVSIQVDSAGAIGNDAVVSFDSTNKILHLGIDSTGATEIQTLIDRINTQGTFTAVHDDSDPADGSFISTATIPATDIGVVTGNTGVSGGNANTFFVAVQNEGSTANDVIAALQANATFTANYQARIDYKDATATIFAGERFITPGTTATLSGGSGDELDTNSGLQITNGGETFTVDLSSAETVQDLLNILNGSGASIQAEMNIENTGINIRSRLSGTELSIGENGGTTATQLGIRSFTANTTLAELNFGRGVTPSGNTDFTIHRNDGVDLEINLSSAVTIQDVLNLINNHPSNTDPLTSVTARLARTGNGIELVDDNPSTGLGLSITRAAGSQAAVELGLIPRGIDTTTATSSATSASATLTFPTPNSMNTALELSANARGTSLNSVNIVFQNTLVGDNAAVAFNAGSNTLTIDIDSSATTANTVLNAINLDGTFSASLSLASDPTNDGSGIIGFTGIAGTTSGGTADTLTGADTNPIEVEGVFSAIIRLHTALVGDDLAGVERAVAMLDASYERIIFSRAELGARSQNLDISRDRLLDEEVELKSNLSQEYDVDIVEAISNLSARQVAYEASLRLSSGLYKTSLLDYL